MKRILPLILVLTLAACGDTEDPSTNNGNTNNNPQPDQGNNNNQPDMNVTPDQGTDMTTPTDMGTDMDMTVTPDQGMDMNNGMACGIDDQFVTRRSEVAKKGGTFTDTPYTESAGLQDLWTVINRYQTDGLFPPNDPATMDVNECSTTDVMLPAADQKAITNAIVTSFTKLNAGSRIILQDKDKAVMLFLAPADAIKAPNGQDLELKPGQRISFKATALKRFGCTTPQVSKISDFVLSGETQSPIYIEDVTGKDIDLNTYYLKMVKTGGRLENFRVCGPGKCFDLVHGPAGSEKINEFRVGSSNKFACVSSVGKCATVAGPVNAFPDIFGTDPKPQFNDGNFDWLQTPFGESECGPDGL